VHCVAVCCSVLQCVAVCCIVLQCVAYASSKCCEVTGIQMDSNESCWVFQGETTIYLAVCCSVLQCVAYS